MTRRVHLTVQPIGSFDGDPQCAALGLIPYSSGTCRVLVVGKLHRCSGVVRAGVVYGDLEYKHKQNKDI